MITMLISLLVSLLILYIGYRMYTDHGFRAGYWYVLVVSFISFFINDFEVMNPSSYIYNEWQNNKKVGISSSAIFTMPAHGMVWGFLTTNIK